MGKAGAYAIQGRAARFVDWIEGSWSNVVGLPVATVDRMIKRLKEVLKTFEPMSSKAIKIAVTCVVLVGALGGLMYTTLAEGTEYYMHVDEVLKDPPRGRASACSCTASSPTCGQRPNTLDYRFQVQNNGQVITASYTGVVPDTFKNGPEVVLKGQLHGDGFSVDANGVMAKCPSKYNPPTPARRGASMASLGSFALLATFVVASYAWPPRWPARGAGRARLIESGVGAFYLTAGLITVASAVIVHAFVTGNYTIKYVQHYSDSASRWPTRSPRTGAGSTARSCSGSSCCRCSAPSPSRSTASAIAS